MRLGLGLGLAIQLEGGGYLAQYCRLTAKGKSGLITAGSFVRIRCNGKRRGGGAFGKGSLQCDESSALDTSDLLSLEKQRVHDIVGFWNEKRATQFIIIQSIPHARCSDLAIQMCKSARYSKAPLGP